MVDVRNNTKVSNILHNGCKGTSGIFLPFSLPYLFTLISEEPPDVHFLTACVHSHPTSLRYILCQYAFRYDFVCHTHFAAKVQQKMHIRKCLSEKMCSSTFFIVCRTHSGCREGEILQFYYDRVRYVLFIGFSLRL